MNETHLLGIPILLALAFVPGAAAVAWTIPGVGLLGRVGAALALSPVLVGVTVTLLAISGLPLGAAGVVALLVSAAAWGIAEWRLRRDRRSRPMVTGEPWRFTLVVAVVVGGLAGYFSLSTEWWRVFSDAWVHQPIVRSIMSSGLPPGDPWFAGFQITYPWIYHAYVAAAAAITGLDAFRVMAWIQLSALVSVILSLGHLIHRVYGPRIGGALAFVLFGLNSLFPLFLLLVVVVRAFSGHDQGFEEFRRHLSLDSYDWHTTKTFLRSIGGQALFLDKFLVTTPFALSLAAMTAWAGSFWRWFGGQPSDAAPVEDPNRVGSSGELGLAALLTLSAGLLHAVVGPHLLVTTAGVAAIAFLYRGSEPRTFRDAWRWSIAVLVGAVPAGIYIASLLGTEGGHTQLPIDLAPRKLFGYASCLALGLIVGFRPAVRLFNGGGAGRMWAAWILAALALATFIRLPGPSAFFTVDKFAYLVWIPLAVPAGGAFAKWIAGTSRVKGVAVAVLLLAPVSVFALFSRFGDPIADVRQPWGTPAHAWMREHLPQDAVLLVPRGDIDTGAFVGRDQYYGTEVVALQRGYQTAELDARRRIVLTLYDDGTIDPADIDHLEALGRPVYAVWPDYSGPEWPFTPGAFFRSKISLDPTPTWGNLFPVVFESGRCVVVAITDDAVGALNEGSSGDGE